MPEEAGGGDGICGWVGGCVGCDEVGIKGGEGEGGEGEFVAPTAGVAATERSGGREADDEEVEEVREEDVEWDVVEEVGSWVVGCAEGTACQG